MANNELLLKWGDSDKHNELLLKWGYSDKHGVIDHIGKWKSRKYLSINQKKK